MIAKNAKDHSGAADSGRDQRCGDDARHRTSPSPDDRTIGGVADL